MRLTNEGESMHDEMMYGHNPDAYLCAERPTGAAFISEALCYICADGFDDDFAYGWGIGLAEQYARNILAAAAAARAAQAQR